MTARRYRHRKRTRINQSAIRANYSSDDTKQPSTVVVCPIAENPNGILRVGEANMYWDEIAKLMDTESLRIQQILLFDAMCKERDLRFSKNSRFEFLHAKEQTEIISVRVAMLEAK